MPPHHFEAYEAGRVGMVERVIHDRQFRQRCKTNLQILGSLSAIKIDPPNWLRFRFGRRRDWYQVVRQFEFGCVVGIRQGLGCHA